MQVRGAPLIAIVAALGLAVDLETKRSSFTTSTEAVTYIKDRLNLLRTSRPTAVNLFTCTDSLR